MWLVELHMEREPQYCGIMDNSIRTVIQGMESSSACLKMLLDKASLQKMRGHGYRGSDQTQDALDIVFVVSQYFQQGFLGRHNETILLTPEREWRGYHLVHVKVEKLPLPLPCYLLLFHPDLPRARDEIWKRLAEIPAILLVQPSSNALFPLTPCQNQLTESQRSSDDFLFHEFVVVARTDIDEALNARHITYRTLPPLVS